jgi:glycosyltransferase involved in cell wall biosynthesis
VINRALFINYELPPIGAGAGNATANIARCLAASGIEVVVLTSSFHGLPRTERRDGYTIKRVPAYRRRQDRSTPVEMLAFMVGGLVPAITVCRHFRPDVVCAFFGVPSGPLALALRRLFRVPYVISLRGGDVPGFLSRELAWFHRCALPLIRAVWYASSGLIANSEGLAELARRTWSTAPLRVIPNGIDTDLFRPCDRTRSSGQLRLLCTGRLVQQKGIQYVLTALAQARTPVVLRLVGDGPQREMLERMVASLKLTNRVQFLGWVPRRQLPEQYQWADVFALPSFEEGMANVVLEALASGLPVVTTSVYGNRGLVEHGENGFLVPPADPVAIAQAIDTLADAPELTRQLGRRSRDVALGYRWERIAALYLRTFEEVARTA